MQFCRGPEDELICGLLHGLRVYEYAASVLCISLHPLVPTGRMSLRLVFTWQREGELLTLSLLIGQI
jgi:hypothetical protein